MSRREWRARAKLTGDPVKDRETREAMLDALHESMAMRGGLRPPVEVSVGEPVREIEAKVCGARAVFWPDVEAIDATCGLPAGHDPSNVHRDDGLGEWDEDDLITTQGEEA